MTVHPGSRPCQSRCEDDRTCPENQKCCFTGCGLKCVDPQWDARSIAQSPAPTGGDWSGQQEGGADGKEGWDPASPFLPPPRVSGVFPSSAGPQVAVMEVPGQLVLHAHRKGGAKEVGLKGAPRSRGRAIQPRGSSLGSLGRPPAMGCACIMLLGTLAGFVAHAATCQALHGATSLVQGSHRSPGPAPLTRSGASGHSPRCARSMPIVRRCRSVATRRASSTASCQEVPMAASTSSARPFGGPECVPPAYPQQGEVL